MVNAPGPSLLKRGIKGEFLKKNRGELIIGGSS